MIETRKTSPQKVADNIFSLLKLKGITQTRATKECGFSVGFFSELKKRNRKGYPDTRNLLPLCDLLGVTIEELLYKDYLSAAQNARIREIDAEILRLKKEREKLVLEITTRARQRQIEQQIEEDKEQ